MGTGGGIVMLGDRLGAVDVMDSRFGGGVTGEEARASLSLSLVEPKRSGVSLT